jgi:hypothetical protein
VVGRGRVKATATFLISPFGVDRKRGMHVRRAERIFPVSRGVIAYIIQNGRASCHAFPEFMGEAVQ